ncbi:MAG: helix-turn-helix domain-containing protein [Bacteroidia bacterium]|nr:helix-turn-helix domain-containing protein [Bacteroidia bacterium]
MKNKELAKKIKELRNRKGFSQEELSEKSGLSLRTIQRIENGETEPRGDSLKRLSVAFDVNPDDLIDWTVLEDRGFLTSLNLSALSFMVFPVLGIIVPLIIWISRKDKVRNVNEIAKEILNFQITWNMVFFIGFSSIMAYAFYETRSIVTEGYSFLRLFTPLIFPVIMYLYNATLTIINSINIYNDRKVNYYPKYRFIK